MALLRKMSLSVFLILVSLVLILSVLFYHVSAVLILNENQKDEFLDQIEDYYSIQDCEWISETVIEQKVITVQCTGPMMGVRILHLNEKAQVIAGLSLEEVHYPMANQTFKTLTNILDFETSLTYYHGESVYWIQSQNTEWLMKMQDYTILWKVEKNDE